MSKTKQGLLDFCNSKLGTPYVYGAKGKALTQTQINTWASMYPGTYTTTYIAKAKIYIGQACTDCSGLISWYTGVLRGSSQYKDTATQTVSINSLNETMIGWALWKSGHIGIYIGNGYCIEAKGIDYGTVKTKVSATAWTHALKLCDIDYSEAVTVKGEWLRASDGIRWWYRFNSDDSNYAKGDFYNINGYRYLFDNEGYMCTGITVWGGERYVFATEDNENMGKMMYTNPNKNYAVEFVKIDNAFKKG